MLKKLESLRGIAACMVFMYHSPFIYGDSKLPMFANSFLFVDFFFILSGFVMAFAYTDKLKMKLDFINYIVLRLGRIYPLHFFVLLLWVPYILIKQYMFMLGYSETDQSINNNFYTFFMEAILLNSVGLTDSLAWNGPSWSIGAEFLVYIFFYIFSISIDKKNGFLLPISISFSCYLLIALNGTKTLDLTYDLGFVRCIGGFYIGVLTHRLVSQIGNASVVQNNINMFEVVIFIGLVVLVSNAKSEFYLFIPLLIAFAFSIYIFSQEQSGFIGNLLLNRTIQNIGLWSYSIYMLHTLILAGSANLLTFVFGWNLKEGLGMMSIIINLVLLAIIISISRFSYKYIERKFRDKAREVLNA